uniref:Flagellar protein FlgJ N-terminal domain-containing protein n=1 Tax=Schlesneria paludicola TaxID=360056 RepID=A0A7C2PB06_9PLAN
MSIAPVTAAAASTSVAERDRELRSTFQQAVAGMLFGQMLKSLRSTVGKPAYLHGGQAEEMFQAQLDQHLVEKLAETNGSPYVGELYRQFRVQLGLPPEEAEGAAGEPSPSAQSSPVDRLAELTESAQQARLGPEGTAGTTGTAALSALFRK